MLRNREFRQFAILFSFIAAAAVTLGFAINTAVGILAIASAAALGAAFFVFTKARYKSIAQISDQIDLVLHNADHLYIGESDEGELSILQSEITKMTLRIREQNDALKKEKEHLADSLADIAHQLRTPLTSVNLILSLLENNPDKNERKALIRETKELFVQMDWLLTSLLKLSRLDAGIVVFQDEQIDVTTLISAALHGSFGQFERSGIQRASVLSRRHCTPHHHDWFDFFDLQFLQHLLERAHTSVRDSLVGGSHRKAAAPFGAV